MHCAWDVVYGCRTYQGDLGNCLWFVNLLRRVVKTTFTTSDTNSEQIHGKTPRKARKSGKVGKVPVDVPVCVMHGIYYDWVETFSNVSKKSGAFHHGWQRNF